MISCQLYLILNNFKKVFSPKSIFISKSHFQKFSKNEMDKLLLLNSYGISEENLSDLIQQAKDYANHKDISMRISNFPKDTRVHLPFCILPSRFPRKWFEYVFELQPYMNYILHKISYSKEILTNSLASTIEADEFTRNIFNIFENVFDRQSEQPSLGLLRSDYLLHCDADGSVKSIKQIENNSIAAGFCGIVPGLRDLYMFILERLGWHDFDFKLPANESCVEVVKGLLSAWNLYGNSSAAILFLVEESTFNICDQRALEFKILELNKDIKVIRCTFKYLRNALSVKSKRLFVKDKEVAVVYYRIGYAPEHYEKEDWDTRLLIEQSKAVKCPSVGLHLAGTKKVQAYLTKKGVLEKFVSFDVAQKLRTVFASQHLLNMVEHHPARKAYSFVNETTKWQVLENNGGDKMILKAIENPEMFVLKAEREGGGHNLYGNDMTNCLKSIKLHERKSYILMDRINPPGIPNCIVRGNKNPEYCHVTCELGIFGVILGNKEKIFENYSAGHLLRSKSKHINEGGVAAGYGALDYPYLT